MFRLRPILGLCLLVAALAAGTIPARAEQDAVQFFRNINVTSDTPVHDAICFFCSVHADGDVRGDIVVFFGNVRLNGAAHHDVVNFFGHVSAADNSSIGGDLVAIFGGIRMGNDVSVGKDVVCLFGDVQAPSSTHVNGNRVGISEMVLLIPLFVIVLIVMLIANAIRAHRRRQFMAGYPFPPGR